MSAATVAVIGTGRLAELAAELLEAEFRMIRRADFKDGVPEGTAGAVVAGDGWDPALHRDAEEAFRLTGTPWVRGFASWGEGVVGPLVRRETPGCSRCADFRLTLAGSDRKENWTIRHRLLDAGEARREPWTSPSGVRLMSRLLFEEMKRLLQGGMPTLESRVRLVNLTTLSTSTHYILPDPLCPACGSLPDDSADAAALVLRPSPKIRPDVYRVRPMEELEKVLAADYLDARTGLMNARILDLQSPFADASVNLPLFAGDEGTAGRTHSYSASIQTAILEGLERHCGLMPRARRTAVRGSFRQLEGKALYPPSVGLHGKAEYRTPDFPFREFDSDLPIDWVWGYSFLRESPILVPETLAYYGVGHEPGFVYETSNGCALGGSLEEAVYYGILEVVERDSFLLPWYARLPLPPLDAESAGDAELTLMVERLRETSGYEVLLFDSTMEHGIPSVWAIARNGSGEGPNLICAAAAHPDPVRAARGAVHELSGMVLTQREKYAAGREAALRMLADPYEVRRMEDHSLLYALPEAEERLRFLLDDRPKLPLRERFPPVRRRPDLADDLRELIDAFRRRDMDVIVVDQTSPEIARNGLRCVKAIIPGMLPMTFGYRLTRLAGLDRVRTVPALLGYRNAPLGKEQLNPHPHPFP